jgi:SAM-dependent methyltransferase
MIASSSQTPAAVAFDHLAEDYDAAFTNSNVGKAQRHAVWECAQAIFTPGAHLLELNCGTGEDAVHFACEGFRVSSCDVSPAMIARAREKARSTSVGDRIRFHLNSTETIGDLPISTPFAGVFSNFSGLNCVRDLRAVALALEPMVQPGAPLVLCFSTRFCFWETAWYLLHTDLLRSFRRWSGFHETKLGGVTIPVYYPTWRQIRNSFSPGFQLVAIYGIGIAVPPSYIEPWIGEHPNLLKKLQKIDTVLRRMPLIRTIGDHMLLHFERLHS